MRAINRHLRAWLLGVTTVLMIATQTFAATGLPVMQRGLEGPNANLVFADKIDAAVAKDSSGNAPIQGGTGGFYTPLHVWKTLATLHPELGFTKANPGKADFAAMTLYIRTLELVKLPETARYINTRLVNTGGKMSLDLNYEVELKKGTEVYADRNTGVAIFKRNCANGLKALEDCVYVDFEVKVPTENRAHYAVYDGDGGTCFAFRKVSKFAEADWPNAKWETPTDKVCGVGNCDFDGPSKVVGKLPNRKGSITVTPGHYQFRISRGHRLSICLGTTDEENPSSFAAITRWDQDYVFINGAWHARIYYVGSDIPTTIKEMGPKWLFFWAENKQAQDRLYALMAARN